MSFYHLNAAVMTWKISCLFLVFLWQFPLPCVVLYATHQENKRLFGFVLRTSGGRSESSLSSVCYIFESNNEGEKVPGFQNVCFIKYLSESQFYPKISGKSSQVMPSPAEIRDESMHSGGSHTDEWNLSASVDY